MIFYALSALVALFCAIALGLGPVVFAAGGVALAAVGFRARRPRWWGLPLAIAGVAEAAGALVGLATRTVFMVSVALFVVLVAVRLAGHRSTPEHAAPGITSWRAPGSERGSRR